MRVSFYYLRFLTIMLFLSLLGCKYDNTTAKSVENISIEDTTKVRVETDYGAITLALSNKTPNHRDNFKKLVSERVYDSLLFHRVIEGFMIQGGDPESKLAKEGDALGSGDLGYTVPAEMDTTLFHKRGVLAAARDGNPERASSASQFYIVQGKTYNDSTLDVAEGRINKWLSEHYTFKNPKNKIWYDSLNYAMKEEDMTAYRAILDTISKLAESQNYDRYQIPEKHRIIYKTLGGAAHLDQNYTIFGEVINGMDVIDSIAAQPVDNNNRPIKDVRILSMTIIND